MLVGRIVVEHGVDHLAGGHLALDVIEEADEFLMPVALHVPADHSTIQHIERGKQRGRAIALVIMGHGASPTFLHRQARLGAVQRLDLGLFIEA